MAGKIGPKEAGLRSMRERRAEGNAQSAKPRAAKSNTVKAVRAELSNIQSNKPNAAAQSNSASAPFDKTAYQREYMRKRRAKAKAAT